jgi:hypothetical protein
MENENLPSIDWIEILKQWAFFFALMTAFFFPAFKFRNLAREHNKTGWVYFIVGLAVGIFGFNLGHLVLFPLRYWLVPQEYVVYLISLLFLSAYFFYKLSYKFLKSYFTRSLE